MTALMQLLQQIKMSQNPTGVFWKNYSYAFYEQKRPLKWRRKKESDFKLKMSCAVSLPMPDGGYNQSIFYEIIILCWLQLQATGMSQI